MCQIVLPQLSYKDRELVTNNLIASTLWTHLTILEPPWRHRSGVSRTFSEPFLPLLIDLTF